MKPSTTFTLFIAVSSLILATACQPNPLQILSPLTLAVRTYNTLLAGVAKTIDLDLIQIPGNESWHQRYRNDAATSIDVYQAEWNLELFNLDAAGALANTEAYWNRTLAASAAPVWLIGLETGPRQGFLPSSLYLWGLFINKGLVQTYMPVMPSTLEELEELFTSVKPDGIVPIALGTSFGWPGAAWFTMLDLRMNGAKATRERYTGLRPFDDAGARAVFNRLALWRDKGWFSPDAAVTSANESIGVVESGRAFCVLLGASAQARFRNSESVRFAAVPYEGSNRAEIVGMQGFFLPDHLGPEKTETAFAFYDALIAEGSLDQSGNSYLIPLLAASAKASTLDIDNFSEIKRIQAGILAKTDGVVSSFERSVPPQALQDSIPLWAGFFGPNGGTGDNFAEKFQSLVGKSLR